MKKAAAHDYKRNKMFVFFRGKKIKKNNGEEKRKAQMDRQYISKK